MHDHGLTPNALQELLTTIDLLDHDAVEEARAVDRLAATDEFTET